MPCLKQACKPRASVFDSNKRETVPDILDLVNGRIDANDFFEENYVTQGMRTFLSESFKRLESSSAGAQGIFRLSQSMGGGKTHNLLAFGLLCQNPDLREKVMGGFHKVGNLGKVRVAAFSGRQTDAQHGIWGEIAKATRQRGPVPALEHERCALHERHTPCVFLLQRPNGTERLSNPSSTAFLSLRGKNISFGSHRPEPGLARVFHRRWA